VKAFEVFDMFVDRHAGGIDLSDAQQMASDFLQRPRSGINEILQAGGGSRYTNYLLFRDGSKSFFRDLLRALPEREALSFCAFLADRRQDYSLQESISFLVHADEPEITKITRLQVADLLERQGVDGEFPESLARIFVLPKTGLTSDGRVGLAAVGELMSNAGGLPARVLFEKVGALRCSTKRFCRFVVELLAPIHRTEAENNLLAQTIGEALRLDGYELFPTRFQSGRTVYDVRLAETGGFSTARSLIFAATGGKPSIGISDVLDGDLALLGDDTGCLVYDRPLRDSLSWLELVDWWRGASQKLGGNPSEQGLVDRLMESLLSPPEQLFFQSYLEVYRGRLADRLPALIPQVYLHYDPLMARELPGGKPRIRQRMDYLMLLPGRQRVVVEIDGKQHYANGDVADPRKYAEMVAADRALRLKGYEVYRFGGGEIYDAGRGDPAANARRILTEFFDALFEVHHIT
jgi:hypothetical protein